MVICNLDIISVSGLPFEADSPLIIDADTVLTGPIPSQLFQMIATWDAQVLQHSGIVQHSQFAHGSLLDIIWQFGGVLQRKYLPSLVATERPDHATIV